MLFKLVLRTPAARWNIAALERLTGAWRRFKRLARMAGAAFVLLMLTQLLYPHQLVRPFARLDGAAIGGWSNSRLATYLAGSVAERPYVLAVTGHTYKLAPASLGIAVNARATAAAVTRYSFADRLVPFSLFEHRQFTEQKTVNDAVLTGSLQKFADERAQDPEDATLAKQNGVYSAVLPGKPGYVVDVKGLQRRLLGAAAGSRLDVPQIAVQPKITQAMLTDAFDNWRHQTGKPVELLLGAQLVTIPPATLQSWVAVAPNQKEDAVLITYDMAAIKQWLTGYASRVYVAPQQATQYIADGVLAKTQPGSDGSTLDVDKSADAVVAAFKAPAVPVRLAAASLQPVPFGTRQVRSYSPTSKGLQARINDWAAGYKPGSVAVSLQEIGGQGRSASLNDTGQFFTASIYKLFVVAYTYHLIETNQLSPSTGVLGTGKSVDACLEATIVVSDNTCPEALGGQLGWVNILAYAQQQGFTATSLADHNWSTDSHDVASYLQKLNAGALINATDTAALLNKMQRQAYRGGIPAGSAGSLVQDKVGFYGAYWHDAAIVHTVKANYILVIFTNGPGVVAIKDLAAEVQQTIDQ